MYPTIKFFAIFSLWLFALPSMLSQSLVYNKINVADAFNLAKSQSKNIFIKYEVDWCQDCKFLNDSVVANPYIQSILRSDYIVVIAPLNHPIAIEWYKKYQVTCIPTINILDPFGQVLFESNDILDEEALYTALLDHAFDENQNVIFAQAESVQTTRSIELLKTVSFPTNVEKSYSGATIHIDYGPGLNTPNLTDGAVAAKQKPLEQATVNIISSNEYTVTVGAFSILENAERQIHKLQDRHLSNEFFIEEDETKKLFRVNVGRFTGRDDCKELVVLFQEKDVSCYIRKI